MLTPSCTLSCARVVFKWHRFFLLQNGVCALLEKCIKYRLQKEEEIVRMARREGWFLQVHLELRPHRPEAPSLCLLRPSHFPYTEWNLRYFAFLPRVQSRSSDNYAKECGYLGMTDPKRD